MSISFVQSIAALNCRMSGDRLTRIRKALPVVSVASAFVATVAMAGAERVAFELGSARIMHALSETLGSFRGTGPSLEELEALTERARIVRRAAYGAVVVFVVATGASLWVDRAEIRRWPWLSGAYLAGALAALYFSLRWFGPLWLLPLVVGLVLGGSSIVELLRRKRRAKGTGAVTWAALVASVSVVVVSAVGVR